VRFCLDADSSVVLRTSPRSDLVPALDGVVVAFEADDVDAGAPSGWSVVVTGRAAVVTSPAEHERLVRSGPYSWTGSPDDPGDPGDVFVRIEAALVAGHELTAGRGAGGRRPERSPPAGR
jgi:hypothetical protein